MRKTLNKTILYEVNMDVNEGIIKKKENNDDEQMLTIANVIASSLLS